MKNIISFIAILSISFCCFNANSQCSYFTKIVSGPSGYHSFGVKNNGTLWAWGGNGSGQFGDGTTFGQYAPVQVGVATDWAKISVGGGHTAFIKQNGTLWICGSNVGGQLGNGTYDQSNSIIQVGADTWLDVSAGLAHTLGIKADGSLWAWGSNSNGQLGDGTVIEKTSPIQIGNATNWSYVFASNSCSYAIKNNGTLWAWGNNFTGQLGVGNTTEQHTPMQVGSATDWLGAKFSASAQHVMVIKTNGTLWAWGRNDIGQLGIGNTTTQNSPVQVGTANNWADISLGNLFCIALKTDGTLWAWGYNDVGQLGDGTTNTRTAPKQIGTATNWTSISTGFIHSMGLRSDGTLYTWGSNQYGQLGLNSGTTNFTSPQKVGTTPVFTGLAPHGSTATMTQEASVMYHQNCALIATVNRSNILISPLYGTVTASVWVESTQPASYVKRHYQITPAPTATGSRAYVTLYFTDAEFISFNNQTPAPALLLPVSTESSTLQTAHKANLIIEKRPGSSANNTGLPNSYSGSPVNIDPLDANIIWNATASRWEVTFYVDGFSGFWVKTQSAALSLPVTFGDVSAIIKNGSLNVKWTTLKESDTKNYTIEGSADGVKWISLGQVESKAISGNSAVPIEYEFIATASSISVAGISIVIIFLSLIFLKGIGRKVLLTVSLITLSLIACNKNENKEMIRERREVEFIRIIQNEINGNTQSSKICRIIKV